MKTSTALATVEPLKISGSHQDREDRAQRLANLFIGEMVPLLVQVRQDFFDKDRDETICGVKTFTEYCDSVLRYSESHIRRLIKGQNPASKKHDGSANRKTKDDAVEPAPHGGEIVVSPVGNPEPAANAALEPITVKELMEWHKASLQPDDDPQANADDPFAHFNIFARRGRNATGNVDLLFKCIEPAIAKMLAEYYVSIRAAMPAPSDEPITPQPESPLPAKAVRQ